jgi:hypothetical protein
MRELQSRPTKLLPVRLRELAASSITPPGLAPHDSPSNEPKANIVDRCPRCKVGSMRMLEMLAPQAEASVRYGAISLRVLQMDTS